MLHGPAWKSHRRASRRSIIAASDAGLPECRILANSMQKYYEAYPAAVAQQMFDTIGPDVPLADGGQHG